MRTQILTFAAITGLMCTAGAFAQQAGMPAEPEQEEITPLTIGDKAPKLDISHWVKQSEYSTDRQFKPISEFEKDNVYVVEFWATWCGPCIASMPHLSELNEKFKDYDVTIVGVSDEPLPTVVEFLWKEYPRDNKRHWDRISYNLTTDPDRSVFNDYMKAAGQRGIPTAFIVGKTGKVEWIGHPMTMDEPLEAVVRDEWDRASFKQSFEERAANERAMTEAREQIGAAIMAENWDAAIEAVDKMIEQYPDNPTYLVQKFMIQLTMADRPQDAYAFGRDTLLEKAWENPMVLNQVAWAVVDEDIEERDLDFAMKAAKRANELTNSENPAILDTLARVYYMQGDLEEAVEWQRRAVKQDEGQFGEELTDRLKEYEAELEKSGR